MMKNYKSKELFGNSILDHFLQLIYHLGKNYPISLNSLTGSIPTIFTFLFLSLINLIALQLKSKIELIFKYSR